MTSVIEPKEGAVIAERYFIEKELGRGGFGIVFRARHLDIEHQVAIKVLLATFADKDHTAIERFRREAVMAAALHYPNTVRVFDYGHTEEGVFYIVMEFLEGTSLDKEMELSGQMEVDRAVHIIEQVLRSLAEAHAHHIVHRDIKPENIMLMPLSFDRDYVKVMDFGIAKMVDADMPSLTQAGKVFGTPKFMAPEQLKGETLSPATDVYAAGHILYELLTGQPVVKGHNLAATVQEVVYGPSATIDRAMGIPEDLCLIVEKACDKDTSSRYPTATHFMEALAQWSANQRSSNLQSRLAAVSANAQNASKTTSIPVGALALTKEPKQPAVQRLAPDKRTTLALVAIVGLQLLTLGAVLGLALMLLTS